MGIDTKPGFRYPCAGEIIFRLATGELEIVYARDEGNGKTYTTLKDTRWRPPANN